MQLQYEWKGTNAEQLSVHANKAEGDESGARFDVDINGTTIRLRTASSKHSDAWVKEFNLVLVSNNWTVARPY